ncbi:MAG: VOC family protein [Acidobacteriota bacterium]
MELSRVIIFTGDVRRMVDFYTSTFGLTMIGEFDDGWTEVDTGSCSIAFHKLGFEVDGTTDDGVKLVFGTKDVAAEKLRLESLGIEMTEIYKWNNIEFCDGNDPDGHRFQISSRGL